MNEQLNMLASLAQLGKVEKSVEINKELKVGLHTLSFAEQQRAMSLVPKEVTDESAKFMYLQIGILTQAIDTVNDKPLPKVQLQGILEGMQYSVLTELFTKYLDLATEQGTLLESLKKKPEVATVNVPLKA